MTTTLTSPARQANTRTIEATDRIGLREAIAHSLTLAHRGLLKVKHNPEQLFDVVIQPIIFTFMFTYIFGGAISGDVESYLPIIIPGILVQTVITASIVTGTQLREDMDKGVFDRFKSLPIARIAPLSGALIADVVRYLIATTITVVVGIAMGYRPGGGFVGVVCAALLVMVCAFAISWIFALMGVLMSKAASVQGTSMMILFPLTFMSNAFVPADTMPGWMQAFVNVNPVSHLVTAVRELANSGHFGIHAVYALLGAAVIVAIMAPLTVRIYMRKA
ncbi:ABC transporter permease [Prescottella equi]|jgi:ABC-2 type transport system permease protein|uniref:Transport permease protein n=1 Tax=Rhodococcus hoagii TaxID=43767 RepID=A0A9Q5RSM0_RHOHA|nr:ABC transporter permease [Prescottella equi]ERN44617.1 ABC transporter transmembrane protein [Prescottella equi NBRC 101255 = C 7]MBM4475683.1 ABC transporter permease [Prescottella equi]MBM4481676.1 ABC transporter permease [Prescottella equi]MBM4486023.1 ABC transporter permease [Prescottella equi]MBM4491670.1 ABC transporter permease [Prescottella equi]